MDLLNLVAKLSLDSSSYESGLRSARSLATSIGSGIGNGLKTIAKVGVAAVGAATTAMGGFVASSVKTGMEFDTAMSQVFATMGSKAEEVIKEGEYAGQKSSEALRDFALEMGRTTMYTASEAAEALNYMALAGYDAATSMQMLPNVLNLAAAGSMDLARASDMLTDTQTAFGISLERTNLLVDEMAKAASTGNTSVEQLGDAFLVVGGLAQELNGGFIQTASGAQLATDGVQELEIALTAMANAGVKGGEAGTHMRNMLLKLSDPTDDGTAALEDMGVTIFDVEGNMRSLTDILGDLQEHLGAMSQQEKISIISDLFNTRDMASAEALLGAVEQKYVKIGDDLVDIKTAYEQYGEAIYDPTQFEIVQSSWDQIGESILDAQIPLEDVKTALDKSGVSWEKYGIKATKQIDKLAGDIRYDLVTAGMTAGEAAADIADAYDMNLGDALNMVNSVKEAWDEASGAAQTMADTQMDNLSGDLKYFQSALEGAKIMISDEVTPALREFVQEGTTGITEIADGFKEGGLSGAMEAFGGVLARMLNMVIENLPTFVDAGVQLLGALGQGIIDNADTLWQAILDIGGQLTDTLIDLMRQAVEGLRDFPWAETAQNIIDWLAGELTGEKAEEFALLGLEIIGLLVGGFADAGEVILQAATDLMTKFTDELKTFNFEDAANSIITAIATFLTNDSVQGFAGAAADLVWALIQGMLDATDDLLTGAERLLKNLSGDISASTSELLDGALDTLIAFSEFISENTDKVIECGGIIIDAVVKGIIQSAPKIAEAVPEIDRNLMEAVDLAISKFAEIGVKIIKDIIDGIKGEAPNANIDFLAILDTVLDISTFMTPRRVGAQIINGIINGITGEETTLDEKNANVIKSIIEAWEDVQQWIDAGLKVIEGILEGLGQGVIDLYTEVQTTIDEVAKKWSEIDWYAIGKSIVDGIIQGIKDFGGGIASTLGGFFNQTKDTSKKTNEISSPSKWYRREIGQNIGKGVILGIEDEYDAVQEAMEGLTPYMELPDTGANLDLSVAGRRSEDSEEDVAQEQEEKYTALANAIVDAFIKAEVGIDVDGREFGRLVRKAVAY